MLHKISRPTCGDKLIYIMNLEYQILCFACKPFVPSDLTEDLFKREFNENGEWLYKKLWTRNGGTIQKSDFFNNLVYLIEYIKSNSEKGTAILEAFKNDTKYHEHFNDPEFKFFYNTTLDEATKQAVKPLMLSILNFFENGLKLSINGEVFAIKRDILIAAFYESNPNLEVCPACDGPSPEKLGNKVYADADHFFPKAKYPFLSIHPENIIPICLYCNQRFKLNRDPFDNSIEAPLVNSFHPYGRCAIDKIDVIITSENAGLRRICIKDREGMPSRRVNNLNRIFKLEERWYNPLHKIIIRRIEEELRDAARRITRYNRERINEDDFKVELNDMLDKGHQMVRREAYSIIYISYLNFILSDKNEFELLFEKFCGT